MKNIVDVPFDVLQEMLPKIMTDVAIGSYIASSANCVIISKQDFDYLTGCASCKKSENAEENELTD